MRYVFKIGSGLISENNSIRYQWLKDKVDQFAALRKSGHEIIIVSSGAVATGMEIHGYHERPKDTLQLQLLSGQGQVTLMKYYMDLFREHDLFIAQILLTHHNFSSPLEKRTIVEIINEYLRQGIIPIINENDMVNKEEFETQRLFTDNDILAALVASYIMADCAILLTDVDGLYEGNPKTEDNPVFIDEVPGVSKKILEMASKATNNLGLGGMYSKVQAAKKITEAGIDTIIANGNRPLSDIISNRVPRTLFKARS